MPGLPESEATIEFGRFKVIRHKRELLADGWPVELGGRSTRSSPSSTRTAYGLTGSSRRTTSRQAAWANPPGRHQSGLRSDQVGRRPWHGDRRR